MATARKRRFHMKKSLHFLTALLILSILAVSSSNALAYTTAANTQIVNVATLNFSGGSATASVTVVVGLIPSTPNISITNGTAAYTAPDTPAITDSVAIISTANGPAEYTVSALVSAISNTNLSVGTGVAVIGTNPITIGATITNGDSAWGSLSVPSDGTADSVVNNIKNGSTIVFTVGATTYTRQVLTVSDPGGSGTATITFATAPGDPPTPNIPAGTPIYEKVTVNLTVLPGTVTATGTPITVGVTATVATPSATDATATNSTPNSWTTPTAGVVITKYVRNATTDGSVVTVAPSPAPTPFSFTFNGETHNYYLSSATSGVSAKPGEVLEYLVVAENTSATTDLSGSFITDSIPITYVSLATGQIGPVGLKKDIWYIGPDNVPNAHYNIADLGSYSAPTLRVNVGNGAGSGSTTGTIPAGKNVKVLYRVNIL